MALPLLTVSSAGSNLIEMRKLHKETFLKKHGVKLGFMSAFVKASSFALLDQPVVNAGRMIDLFTGDHLFIIFLFFCSY